MNLAEAATALSSGYLIGAHSHWQLAAALLVLVSVLAAIRRLASRRSPQDKSPRWEIDADRPVEVAVLFDAAAFDAAIVTITSILYHAHPARLYTIHAFFKEVAAERREKGGRTPRA